MNAKCLPYLALLLFILAGAGSWAHRRHLRANLNSLQEQVREQEQRRLDSDNIAELQAELAACQKELKTYE